MEISNEKFGMLLKEAASEAGRRRGISVARTLIDEGVVGSTSSLSWLYNGQSKDDEKYVTVMQKIIDLLPSWRKEHYYSEIGKIVLERQWEGEGETPSLYSTLTRWGYVGGYKNQIFSKEIIWEIWNHWLKYD